MAISAHKIGGPQGVGALVVDDEVALSPMLRGGGQERGLRAGTENVAGIAGFGAAARMARAELSDMPAVAQMRDALEAQIRPGERVMLRRKPVSRSERRASPRMPSGPVL